MEISPAARDKRKSNVALLSVISNSSLVIIKLAVGTMIGSVSVISEAIHSSVDLLAAIIALAPRCFVWVESRGEKIRAYEAAAKIYVPG